MFDQINDELTQQGLDGEKNGPHLSNFILRETIVSIFVQYLIQSGPLLLEDVEADIAVRVNIWVEARGGELHCRRLVWITWELLHQSFGQS